MARDSGSPMKGTWRRRYRRLLDLPAGVLRGRILNRVKQPIFAGGLYDRLLLGRREPTLRTIPTDPWPADAARGREIATGSFHLAQQTIREPVPLGRPIGAGEEWRLAFNSFDWLADLMALGGPAAPVALAFLERWLAENQRWEALASRPGSPSPRCWKPAAMAPSSFASPRQWSARPAISPMRCRAVSPARPCFQG